MGHGASKIYTRTGDNGATSTGDGERVSKDSGKIEAAGCVDELSSVIGLLLVEDMPEAIQAQLLEIQHDLSDLNGSLAFSNKKFPDPERITRLEGIIDLVNADLQPLREFILPGGSRAATLGHLARTVCRRAERRVVCLAREELTHEMAVTYLNRLSDLLFVMARALNRHAGIPDVLQDRSRFYET